MNISFIFGTDLDYKLIILNKNIGRALFYVVIYNLQNKINLERFEYFYSLPFYIFMPHLLESKTVTDICISQVMNPDFC